MAGNATLASLLLNMYVQCPILYHYLREQVYSTRFCSCNQEIQTLTFPKGRAAWIIFLSVADNVPSPFQSILELLQFQLQCQITICYFSLDSRCWVQSISSWITTTHLLQAAVCLCLEAKWIVHTLWVEILRKYLKLTIITMGTTDTTHMLLVVALEVMKIAVIVTITTAARSPATTVTIVMIIVIMIDGTMVEDDATKSKAHCRTMWKIMYK